MGKDAAARGAPGPRWGPLPSPGGPRAGWAVARELDLRHRGGVRCGYGGTASVRNRRPVSCGGRRRPPRHASARDRMGAGAEADPHVTPQTAAPPPHGRSSVRRITADRGIPGPPSLPWPATDGPPQREARPSPDTARTAARERRPSDPRPPDPRRPVAVHRGRG